MSAVFVVDPRGMSPTEWTAASTISLERLGPIPMLLDDGAWQQWGADVSHLSSMAGVGVPNPYDFVDFEAWASRFNQSLAGIS